MRNLGMGSSKSVANSIVSERQGRGTLVKWPVWPKITYCRPKLALIEGQNDTVETAKKLGILIRKYNLRRDMVHVNVIPLNPTGGFTGSASGRQRVNEFMRVLNEDFGVACTPRVRRGIDIDAGCGQLKSKALFEENEEKSKIQKGELGEGISGESASSDQGSFNFDFATTVDLDSSDVQYDENDEVMDETFDPEEAARLLAMVEGTVLKEN